jgi:hypothetical protein
MCQTTSLYPLRTFLKNKDKNIIMQQKIGKFITRMLSLKKLFRLKKNKSTWKEDLKK